MWQETKHGLYKQFVFKDFRQAFDFMKEVAEVSEHLNHHPRWENQWNVVQMWLSTEEGDQKITEKDRELANEVDKIVNNYAPQQDIDKTNRRSGYYKLKIYADGGSRGNPGPSASGYVIMDEEDKILVDMGVYLGVTTNNQAEYTSLKLAMEECLKLGAREVDVYMDSLLVINQMKGVFKVRNRDLWPIHDAINGLAKGFKKVSYQHIPRELNKLADSAVNRAIDEELAKI
ncbi:MAG: reverse transcriptase-like protein [Candidatus Saccharimonadales bacterium]